MVNIGAVDVLGRGTLCKCFDYDMEREYVRLTNLYMYRYRYGDMVNIVGVDDQTCSCGHQLFSSSKLESSYFPTLLLFSQVGEEASWQK